MLGIRKRGHDAKTTLKHGFGAVFHFSKGSLGEGVGALEQLLNGCKCCCWATKSWWRIVIAFDHDGLQIQAVDSKTMCGSPMPRVPHTMKQEGLYYIVDGGCKIAGVG